MRRWLILLLLAFLPLQFSWAAVARYCGHETSAAAGHIGHHDHAGHSHAAKDVDAGQAGQADGTASGASNLDCGHCHGHFAGMVDGVAAFAPRALAGTPPGRVDCACAEHTPAQPERPQWAALA